MRDTLKAVSRFYLAGVIWFVVLVGTALALMGSMGTLYAALDLSPAMRTAVTLAIAVSAATIVARLGWSHMGVARRSAPQGRPATTLVAPRSSIRL